MFTRPLWKCSSSPDPLCTFIASDSERLRSWGPFGKKHRGKSKSSVSCGLARPWLLPLLSSGETVHARPTIVHVILFIVINTCCSYCLLCTEKQKQCAKLSTLERYPKGGSVPFVQLYTLNTVTAHAADMTLILIRYCFCSNSMSTF